MLDESLTEHELLLLFLVAVDETLVLQCADLNQTCRRGATSRTG